MRGFSTPSDGVPVQSLTLAAEVALLRQERDQIAAACLKMGKQLVEAEARIKELEQALAEQHVSPDLAAFWAERGAEVERKECIDVVATSGDQFASVVGQAEVQKRIRARGAP